MPNASYLSELTPDTRARVEELLGAASELGIEAKITSGLRSCAEQTLLHEKGITPVTGCRSWHVQGRAVDLYIGSWDPAAYAPLGARWEKMGGIWGGRWGDAVHFEWHPGLSIDELCPLPGQCASSSSLAVIGKGLFAGGLAVGLYLVWTNRRRRR
jgi:hypothetical protein